jgi:hypothetical protein
VYLHVEKVKKEAEDNIAGVVVIEIY